MNRLNFARSPSTSRLLVPSLLLLSCLASCGERTLDIGVKLITTTCPDLEGQVEDVLRHAHFLEFVISGDGMDEPMALRVSRSSEQAVLQGVPISGHGGVRRRIEVNARAGSPVGPIVARGAAVVFVSDEVDAMEVPVFMRPLDQFAFTSLSELPETCSVMNRRRSGHTATILRDGRVLIVGGALLEDTGRTVHASAEIFDPRTGVFQLLDAGAGPKQPRVHHTATLLRTGRVLVAGGEFDAPDGTPQANRSAEIFDPATESFLPAIRMTEARTRHTATAVAGDMVLLAGGYVDPNPPSGATHPLPTKTTDVFHASGDGGQGAFTQGIDLPDARAEHCALATQGGTRVVLAGGKTLSSSGAVVTNATLRYLRAEEDSFTLLGNSYAMRNARHGHACGIVVNPSGGEQIVMAGGFRQVDGELGADDAVARVEVFDPSASQTGQDLDSLSSARGWLCSAESDGALFFVGGHMNGSSTAAMEADRLAPEPTGPKVTAVQGNLNEGRHGHRCTTLLDGSILVTGGERILAGDDGVLSIDSAEILTPRSWK